MRTLATRRSRHLEYAPSPTHRKPHIHGLSIYSLALLEIVVLAPIAAVLALWLIPDVFQIQWGCVSSAGVRATRGDDFAHSVAVFGTLGWLLVGVAVLFAHIAERPRLAAILPLASFVALVGGTAIAAAAIGPALCPS